MLTEVGQMQWYLILLWDNSTRAIYADSALSALSLIGAASKAVAPYPQVGAI